MSRFTPRRSDQDEQWLEYIIAKDVEKTAKTIFGPDIRQVKHEDADLYYYDSHKQKYITQPHGGGIPHTRVHIIDIQETDKEYILSAVHAFHCFCYYDDIIDEVNGVRDIYDDLGHHVVTLDDHDEDYSAYLSTMPVRNYFLTKHDDGNYYLRKSIIVEAEIPDGT